MKVNKNVLRVSLIVAAMAVVSVPALTSRLIAKDRADAAADPPAAPSGTHGAADAGRAASGAADSEPATAPRTDPAKVIAKAGGVEVTAGEFEHFYSGLPPQAQAQLAQRPEGKRLVAEQLLNVKVMAREAERRKMDQEPATKAQLAIVRDQVLANELARTLTTDAEADRKYFDEHKADFDKLQGRHILISTRSADPQDPKPARTDDEAKTKAQDLRKRIDNGEDFAKLASAESDDPGSKAKGGDLGEFSRGMMVPPFEEAAYGMKVGDVSQPVKSDFGYHIIQVQKRNPMTFDEARPRVERRRLDQLLEQLKGGKPELDPAFFGPDPSATAPK